MSRNSMRQVSSSENNAQNTINRSRPISGNRNSPTWTVPAEHSHAKHAADDSCRFGIKRKHCVNCKKKYINWDFYLPPTESERFPSVTSGAADRSATQRPTESVSGRFGAGNECASPTMWLCPAVILATAITLRLYCQLFRNLGRLLADSRPAPDPVSRPAEIRFRPFRRDQIPTVWSVGVVASPT